MAHYRRALAAMDRAFEKAGADNPSVANAVVKALDEKNPKFQTIVGKGTAALLMLTRLPVGLRDSW